MSSKEFVTKRDGLYRECPAGIGASISRQFWSLDAHRLCAGARRRAGLQDFGSPSVEPMLSILTDSLNREANLHGLGHLLMRLHLRGLLETRLRLVDLWRTRPPDWTDSPIESPIFITGIPRSGSTFLHELLAQDPNLRAPRIWEVMFPLPGAAVASGSADSRVRKAAMCLWFFRLLAPGADSVFPMRAQTPHECVAIHSYTFLSEEFISSCRIPAYESFLRRADLRPAYQWQRRFLQHLQWGKPVKRWVLKSPDHVRSLDELFGIFPDARVVVTHRDPLEVIQSSCYLNEVLQGLFARPLDPQRLLEREATALAEGIDRLAQFRAAHPELKERFIDVMYPELTADPVGVLSCIYDRFAIPFSPRTSEAIRSFASRRGRYRKDAPGMRAGRYPADAVKDDPRFERYCARFGIARRRAA